MSRVAKMPIGIPEGVAVGVEDAAVCVKGPRGELEMRIHDAVEVEIDDGWIRCRPKGGAPGGLAHAGTARSLIANMVTGVCEGFQKELRLVGVGYRGADAGRCTVHVIGVLAPDRVPVSR